jgi:hypothetical protein
LIPPQGPHPNPRLTRWRIERNTNGVSKRLGKIMLKFAICADDDLDRNDWHAV